MTSHQGLRLNYTSFRASNLLERENATRFTNHFRCELACSCIVMTIVHLQVQRLPHNIGANASVLQ